MQRSGPAEEAGMSASEMVAGTVLAGHAIAERLGSGGLDGRAQVGDFGID